MCLSVCLSSVCALTFEGLELESSFSRTGTSFKSCLKCLGPVHTSRSQVKVKGTQNGIYEPNYMHTFVGGLSSMKG